MTLHRTTLIGLLLLPAGVGCPAGLAATLTVGKPNTPCPNARYTTIADAVKAAASGDVIEICPALYPEQLLIDKPLTLRGIIVQGVNRVLIQPSPVVAAGAAAAVITVANTTNVAIENLAIDAGNNTFTGCDVALSAVHFYNSSGTVANNAITGASLRDPTTCPTLFPGTGFGVQVEKDPAVAAPVRVSVQGNSITKFSRNGVLVVGAGITAGVYDNSIAGVGPGAGVNQFGIFLANGAVGVVTGNMISQGTCGAIALADCFKLRGEGVVLRSAGDGTVVDGNSITNVQSGVFVNGANNAQITNNVIRNVDALSAIQVQNLTNGLIAGNRIFNVGPIGPYASANTEGCGINEIPDTGNGGNTLRDNAVNDAFCGVAYVTGDWVEPGVHFNTLYSTLNSDDYPDSFPPAAEPRQSADPATTALGFHLIRKKLD